MKKQLPTHNDEPSIKPAPKVLKVEEPNYEGTVKQGKYEVEEHISIHTDTQPRSKSGDPYPIPDHEIDIYSVDTRIWDRIGEMGGGDGGGPHTHDDYATKTELTNGLATKSDDPHTHNYADVTHNHTGVYQPAGDYATNEALTQGLAGKSDTDHTHEGGGDGYNDTEVRGLIADNASDIADLQTENISQNSNIQANTDALSGKSDTGHDHTQYVKGEGATGLAMWIGSQEDYDAIVSKRLTTLYVVM